jgi:hypothetical protein
VVGNKTSILGEYFLSAAGVKIFLKIFTPAADKKYSPKIEVYGI